MERSHSGLSSIGCTPRRLPEIEKIDFRHSQLSAFLLMTALQRDAHVEIKQVVRGSPTLFARGHPDAAPAIAEARVEASAKVMGSQFGRILAFAAQDRGGAGQGDSNGCGASVGPGCESRGSLGSAVPRSAACYAGWG
jgi:hypothetical protein